MNSEELTDAVVDGMEDIPRAVRGLSKAFAESFQSPNVIDYNLETAWKLRRKMDKLASSGGTLKYTPPEAAPVLFDVLYAEWTLTRSGGGTYVRDLEFLCRPFARRAGSA